MKTFPVCFVLLLPLLTAPACKPSDDGDGGVVTATTVPFEGTPDPKFVGVWKVKNGRSTYTLKEDGKFELVGIVTNQGKTMENRVSSEWRANDKHLIFKDASGNAVPYDYTLTGKEMKLSLTGKLKNEMILVKQ